jgi:hypothetical protein
MKSMAKPSREHHSDEFGQPTLGSVRGVDAPQIGAPTNVIIDGIVERESGVTPSPPPFSVKTAIIVLVAMMVLGLLMHLVLSRLTAPSEAIRAYREAIEAESRPAASP